MMLTDWYSAVVRLVFKWCPNGVRLVSDWCPTTMLDQSHMVCYGLSTFCTARCQRYRLIIMGSVIGYRFVYSFRKPLLGLTPGIDYDISMKVGIGLTMDKESSTLG